MFERVTILMMAVDVVQRKRSSHMDSLLVGNVCRSPQDQCVGQMSNVEMGERYCQYQYDIDPLCRLYFPHDQFCKSLLSQPSLASESLDR